MKKNIKNLLIGTLLCLMAANSPLQASNYYQPNVFFEAMRVMIEMFLTMSGENGYNYYGNRLRGSNSLNNQPWSPNVTPFNTPDNPRLEGTWLSNNRFVLVIQDGYARIAVDQNDFQDFYVRYRPGVLQLRDGQTGRIVSFRMVQQNNRMALQDQHGRFLIFKKVQ